MRQTESFGTGISWCVDIKKKKKKAAMQTVSVFSTGIIAVSQIAYFCGRDKQFEENRTIKYEIVMYVK